MQIAPSSLIWLFSAANLLAFHLPLLRYLRPNLELGSTLGLGVLVVLACVSVMLMWLVLGAASLLSARLLKPLVLLLCMANGVALYAMNSYQVMLDKTMMGNVWNTDSAEAAALFHPKLLLYLALAGVLPAWVLWRLRLMPEGRLRRALHVVVAWGLGCLLIFSQSSAWLWIDLHAKAVGGLLLPWSYTFNSARHFAGGRNANRPLAQLPPIQWLAQEAGFKPVTVVLVIGEAARAQSFSLYGYARQTNPQLAKHEVAVLKGARSCATYTTRSLECILSHQALAGALTHEILPNYLNRSGQVDVSWRSRNWGEPPLIDLKILRGDALSALCVPSACTTPDQDEALLAGLELDLAQSRHKRQLVVLHQAGSHGPAYHKKYPANFARFTPVCESVDLKKCSTESLINAYDNTIAYTDDVLARLITLLEKQTERRTVLIYVSDHGQSLGEGGWYLHGAPDVLAPDVQKDIPFLVWMSPAFAQDFSLRLDRLGAGTAAANSPLANNAQALVFHSVLGALGGRSPVYRADHDIFEPKAQR
jgi:lipid A ethanolaminephosphotransferase